ncbi:MAG: hypothetical protein AUH85_09300 [Chloroflexi bacterium 13_1_40CM_4_68_4]|nr:MAG: hypothetical protein AUH85_09300 [Chloroflexi bacterium 13_1_40CM_4_68_4]
MNEARAVLVLSIFIFGLVAGGVVNRLTDTGPRANPYPSLDRVEEPQQSAQLATALSNSDAKALAGLMDNDTLGSLRDALMSPMGAPIVDIRSVRFIGATSKSGKTLAGYVISGKDAQGTDAIIGFVLDIEHGQIVGVN